MMTLVQITTIPKINTSPPTAATALISPEFDATGTSWLLSVGVEVVELTVDEGGDVVLDVGDDVTIVELTVDVWDDVDVVDD